jgi:hypothetical protein
MSAGGNGAQGFQLGFSGVVAARIRALQRRASREGRGAEFLAGLRQVVQDLRRKPRKLGEALYRLKVLRMQVRCVVAGPLYVDFAVCEDRPLVFIKSVKLLARKDT